MNIIVESPTRDQTICDLLWQTSRRALDLNAQHRFSWNTSYTNALTQCRVALTHCGQDKMAVIFQTTFSNTFSWKATIHYLNQWCSVYWRMYASFDLNGLSHRSILHVCWKICSVLSWRNWHERLAYQITSTWMFIQKFLRLITVKTPNLLVTTSFYGTALVTADAQRKGPVMQKVIPRFDVIMFFSGISAHDGYNEAYSAAVTSRLAVICRLVDLQCIQQGIRTLSWRLLWK